MSFIPRQSNSVMRSLPPFRKALVLATGISTLPSHGLLEQRQYPLPHTNHRELWSLRGGRQNFSSKSDDNPRELILRRSPKEDEKILNRTLDWLQRSVIGLNLCPFAEKPFQRKQMNLEVVHGTNQVDILAQVLGECLAREKRAGTSLMICPDLFPSNFISFLEVYNMLQDGVLVDNGLEGHIQIAPFHPLFEFEGSEGNIDNLTNRSPYPIFHILREEEVSVAVEALQGDSEKVWKRNIQLLEALEGEIGRANTTKVLEGEKIDAQIRKNVDKILQNMKNGGWMKPSDVD